MNLFKTVEFAAFSIDIVLVHLKRGAWDVGIKFVFQEFQEFSLIRKNIYLVRKYEEFLLLSKSNHGLNIFSCEHLQERQ